MNKYIIKFQTIYWWWLWFSTALKTLYKISRLWTSRYANQFYYNRQVKQRAGHMFCEYSGFNRGAEEVVTLLHCYTA